MLSSSCAFLWHGTVGLKMRTFNGLLHPSSGGISAAPAAPSFSPAASLRTPNLASWSHQNCHGVSQSDMTASCHAMSRTLTSSIQFSASNQFLNPSAGSCQIVASPPLRSITILYCIDPPTACPACATSSGSRSAPSFDREGAAGGSQRVELYQPARYRLENVEQR